MTLLLLPGADGTGLLFEPLLKQIKASEFKTVKIAIINLNYDEYGQPFNQSLAIQAQRIEDLYAHESVQIIAESYSGLLAYELLIRQRLEITHVVFVASFLSTPSILAPMSAKLKPKWLQSALKYTPERIWGRVVFGKWQNDYLRSLFMEAMQQTPNELLQQRLDNIATVKAPTIVIDTPCLYLQGKQDNLVAAKNIAPFRQLFTNFDCQVLEGTHFLLQTNPQDAWLAINSFLLN